MGNPQTTIIDFHHRKEKDHEQELLKIEKSFQILSCLTTPLHVNGTLIQSFDISNSLLSKPHLAREAFEAAIHLRRK